MDEEKDAEKMTNSELLIRLDSKMNRVLTDVTKLYERSGETREKATRNEQRIKSNHQDIRWNRRWFGVGIILTFLGIVVATVARLFIL